MSSKADSPGPTVEEFFVDSDPSMQTSEQDRLQKQTVTRALEPADLQSVLGAQELAHREMGDLYFPHSPRRVSGAISSGMSIGTFRDCQLVAMRLVEIPTTSEPIFLEQARVSPKDATSTAQFVGLFVLPDYRGHALGTKLTCIALERLQRSGVERILTTVGPSNYSSLATLLRLGFASRALLSTFGGLARFVLGLSLGTALVAPVAAELWVDHDNHGTHQQLFRRNYRGIAVRRRQGGHELGYARLHSS